MIAYIICIIWIVVMAYLVVWANKAEKVAWENYQRGLLKYIADNNIISLEIQDGKGNALLDESYKATAKQLTCNHRFIKMGAVKSCHKCLKTI